MSYQPPESISNGAEPLKIWSCTNCRRRKVRCDRRHPCAPCTRNKTECVFPVSGRIPRRSRDANYPHPPVQNQAELAGRLRRLEAMVGGLSSQVESAALVNHGNHSLESSASGASTASSESGWPGPGLANSTSESPHASEDSDMLQVASNGDLVVGKGFWTVFCKEVEDIFEAVQGHTVIRFDEDSSSSMSGNSPHTGYYNFLLRTTSAGHQRGDIHPLPSQMLFLWQIYLDNIDSFIKILHVPSMTKVIREIRGSYNSLGSSMQALVLAISLAAIMSLEHGEVNANFNTDKDQLVARYRLGTEKALEQADFLNTPDITALQALAIYISVLQHTGEAKPAWLLAGVLVRVGLSMKLHRDGSHFANITTFEAEMRRRLWWQICFIDSRSEDFQVFEYKISENMFDTKFPTNTDDANLVLGMSHAAVAAEGWTSMTIFLVRCEVWKLCRRLQSSSATSFPHDIDRKLELFQQSQKRIENTYLKHLNPNQPLHSFVATSTRLFVTKVELILYTKRHGDTAQLFDAPQSDKLFMSSLSIIEYTHALQNEPTWSGWSWQTQGRHPPWQALHFVLSKLITRSWEPICERTWLSAKRSLDSLPDAARSDPRYQQLLTLTSAVQRRVDEYYHQVAGDATFTTVSPLPDPVPQVSKSGSVSSWTPQEPFLDMTDNSGNNNFSSDLGGEMDWQVWDEIAGDLEFWDMGGL